MALSTVERSASVDGERAVEGADAGVLLLAGGLARRLLQPTETRGWFQCLGLRRDWVWGLGATCATLVSAGWFLGIFSGLGFAST